MNLTLDYVSLGIMIVILVILIYGMIAIHDIPAEIAKKRNHPYQDAIHVAGWVSLFLMHALWPLLWIWAMMGNIHKQPEDNFSDRLDDIEARLNAITVKNKEN